MIFNHTKRAETSVSDSLITVQSSHTGPDLTIWLGFTLAERGLFKSAFTVDICAFFLFLYCLAGEKCRGLQKPDSHACLSNRFLHVPVQPKWTIFKDPLVIYLLIKQVNISNEMVMIFLHVLNHKHGLFGRCIWFVNSPICCFAH